MISCFMVEPVYDPMTKLLEYVWDADHHIGSPVYRRLDNGERIVGYAPGMMHYTYGSEWSEELQGQIYTGERVTFTHPGPDGKSLVVVLPDGTEWYIDSIANNCAWKDKPHNCWSRSGPPPDITVGKGPPCCDGQGSIKTPNYHGHLRNGQFTDNMP